MVERPNDVINITTNATTLIGGTGTHQSLYRVIVGTAGTTSTLKIYKGQSAVAANLIGTFSTLAQISFDFGGLRSKDGWCFVSAGGAAADLTVVFD